MGKVRTHRKNVLTKRRRLARSKRTRRNRLLRKRAMRGGARGFNSGDECTKCLEGTKLRRNASNTYFNCQHHFCKECVLGVYFDNEGSCQCPECRAQCNESAIKNLIGSYKGKKGCALTSGGGRSRGPSLISMGRIAFIIATLTAAEYANAADDRLQISPRANSVLGASLDMCELTYLRCLDR